MWLWEKRLHTSRIELNNEQRTLGTQTGISVAFFAQENIVTALFKKETPRASSKSPERNWDFLH